ncbi:NHL repeat-containing protein [Noviherbaspirillum denitrificans]|uniref:NHL repeat-containing protein n=1 Tax=Noviherbaspirillum denitrificans TaxID=1968433 RepID=UPI0014821684|nr:NHL repeat-containing protein [Noviherbaspirillum denitrificans]
MSRIRRLHRRSNPFALLALWLLLALQGAWAETYPTKAIRHLFDITGGAAGPLAVPTDVAVGKDGRIYVVDGGNHRLVAFGPSGQYLFSIGRAGTGKGEFKSPVGVGTDSQGRVYVADSGNNRIQIFDGAGNFIGTFPVASNGKPIRPIDVAPDAEGKTLYVTGNNNHKVMAFSPSGQLLREWGGEGLSDGEFRYPATISVTPNGLIFVVDVMNTRVQVFDKRGRLGFRVGEWGVLPGQFLRPKGVAIDSGGWSYVSDSYMDVIQVFDNSYRFQHVLGADGNLQRFNSPGGLAIDNNNRLYVVEMLGNKVSVHSLR